MEIRKSQDINSEFNGVLHTGTTTIGLAYKGGIIIATESQATAGFFIATKNAQKLFKVNDYVAATISGGVADCQYIVNQARVLSNIRTIETGQTPGAKYMANIIRNMLFNGRSYYLSLMIVGGYNHTEKKSVLFGIDLLGALFTEERFLSYGSGSPYALGVLEAEWKPNLTEKKATDVVKRALTSAISRDAGSGYKFQIIKITKAGIKEIENFHDAK